MFYRIKYTSFTGKFLPTSIKTGPEGAGYRVQVNSFMRCRWQHVKYKTQQSHSYCRYAAPLDDKPSQTEKPCRVPPEMFLQSQESPSKVPLTRPPYLNSVTFT